MEPHATTTINILFAPSGNNALGFKTPETKALAISVQKALDNKEHSPILGYMFDGFPTYGPIGKNKNGKKSIMQPRYQPTGKDEYRFQEGSGDLDICNGVLSPTPEYPEGIYHYHMTVKSVAGSNALRFATN